MYICVPSDHIQYNSAISFSPERCDLEFAIARMVQARQSESLWKWETNRTLTRNACSAFCFHSTHGILPERSRYYPDTSPHLSERQWEAMTPCVADEPPRSRPQLTPTRPLAIPTFLFFFSLPRLTVPSPCTSPGSPQTVAILIIRVHSGIQLIQNKSKYVAFATGTHPIVQPTPSHA
jgi:hypothetical protein